MFRTEDKPAPGRLVIVHGFLNTWSAELGLEDFKTPQSTGRWLRAAGLWRGRRSPTEDDVARLKTFRDTLRKYVLDRTSPANIAAMNEVAAATGFTMFFDDEGRPVVESTADGADYAIGTMIGIIQNSVADGTWERFKCCELETCGWAYYDHTKNRSGRWCSMKTCGSRHKAREYLKRKAQQDS